MKSSKPHSLSCDCHGTDGKPLSRDEFREYGLKRDNYQCAFCGSKDKLSVHHIIERRLFTSCFGYHKSNGISVCDPCHLLCEQTVISCEEARDQVGITDVVLPEYMYPDHQYTKWGDVILSNNTRMPGPLFYDESVQKVLKDGKKLDLYTKYVKYPRTYHHPLSKHKTEDDKILFNASEVFKDKQVVVTVKMDGSNFTGYTDYCHGRSIDSMPHEELRWAKGIHFQKYAYNLPEGFRYIAENLHTKHTIHYTDLDSLLLGFQMWDKNTCLSWEDTKEWFELLELPMVEELYIGVYDEKVINSLFEQAATQGHEGIIVRNMESFSYNTFRFNVTKLVKEDFHIDGSNHFRFKRSVLNNLKGGA